MKFDRTKLIEALRRVIRRMHYPLEVMLVCVRWYAAYPLSFRNIEEMMAERGVFVDHSTLHRWSSKMLPVLAPVFRRRKRAVGRSWRMDETYIKVAGQWKYLYRAVDNDGATVAFLLRAKQDHAAAREFFKRAIGLHDVPKKISIDKSGANTASFISDSFTSNHRKVSVKSGEDQWLPRYVVSPKINTGRSSNLARQE